MRRHDREITDPARIDAFLREEQILRIAFSDRGEIYIVPVNYGLVSENGRYAFYFHGAKAGRKYSLALASPKVGFEIDGRYRLIAGEAACEYTASFQSVIGTGTLHLVEDGDTAQKRRGLNALMRQTTGRSDWEYSDAMLAETAVFRLDADTLSCKAK